ncbi:MAG: HPr family phosphocarrier protein [Cardiobacteriaceae bacterium]|nr:HPr family phosphocarrier protein [Cardiobacteriaceae bacterium]
MQQQSVTLQNPTGLHARPGRQLVELAKKFNSDIRLVKENTRCNAKSLMKVLQAGFGEGSTITIECEGSDEEFALAALVDYVSNLKE